MITKFLKRLKDKILKQKNEEIQKPVIIERIRATNDDYKKRWQLYQLTGDSDVFSENYVLPEIMPIELKELSKEEKVFKYNYRSELYELEMIFRNIEYNNAAMKVFEKYGNEFKNHMDFVFNMFTKEKLYSIPDNRNLTRFMLEYYKPKSADFIYTDIVCNYSYNFDVSELEEMFKKIIYFDTRLCKNSPLLISFLDNDIFKILFYKQIGFKGDFKCTGVYILGFEGSDPSETFVLRRFECSKELRKKYLDDAISELHLLNSDIISAVSN